MVAIPVDGDVETEKLDEAGVFAKAKESGQVVRVIFGRVNSGKLSATENVAIDATGNVRELRNPEARFSRIMY